MRGLRRLQTMTPLPDDHDLVEQCFGSADFKEGVTAFFDKRKPDWKGV
jgi:enoyl-CoA hydratase/carnithine racemase